MNQDWIDGYQAALEAVAVLHPSAPVLWTKDPVISSAAVRRFELRREAIWARPEQLFDACRVNTHAWSNGEPCEGVMWENHPNLPVKHCACACHKSKPLKSSKFKEKIQKVLDSKGRTLVKSRQTTKQPRSNT